MALKVITKINSRPRFLYRTNRFLSQPLCTLFFNSLIQLHVDYVSSAWCSNLIFWNKLPNSLKRTDNLNTCKHKVKDHFFHRIKNQTNKIYTTFNLFFILSTTTFHFCCYYYFYYYIVIIIAITIITFISG